MQTIYVFEIAGIKPVSCLGAIDTFSSFNFTKSFQGAGSFQIKGIYEGQAKEFKAGRMIWLNQTICGIIESVDIVAGKGTETYTVYGHELSQVLSYRISWNTYNHNLAVNKWLEGLVRENTQGNRQLFQNIETSDIACPNIDKQVSYESLLKTLEDVCTSYKTSAGMLLGFEVICPDADSGFTFHLQEGRDRTYGKEDPFLITRVFDNVSHLTLTSSTKGLANVVKAGGAGEGAERKFCTAGDLTLSGFDRREVFKDSRNLQKTVQGADGTQTELTDAQYTALLQTEANSVLKPKTLVVDVDAVVSQEEAFDLLGSKVSFIDRDYGVRVDDYVYSVNLILEGGSSYLNLTVGSGLQAQKLIL